MQICNLVTKSTPRPGPTRALGMHDFATVLQLHAGSRVARKNFFYPSKQIRCSTGRDNMSRGPAPKKLVIPRKLRRQLGRLIKRRRTPHIIVNRAKLILFACKGMGTKEIAERLDMSDRNVRKWKARIAEDPHIHSLEDRERSGRPPTITIELRCRVVALACERPDDPDAPDENQHFRDLWTHASLADAIERATGRRISVSELGRILRFEKLRPHLVRQWLKSTDPEFDAKAKRVCNLYMRPPKDAIIVCVDEKPLQVLERKHPTHVSPHDGSVRREYEYIRHGTQALLAAFNVRTGEVFARVVPNRTANALVAFMDELAAHYPDKTVYVIWDNLNIHYDGKDARWTEFNERHERRFRFVYTPKHASWMNQIEIWFSILQRRVLRHGSFASHGVQARRVLGFVKRWNQVEAHPFRWTWRAKPRQDTSLRAA